MMVVLASMIVLIGIGVPSFGSLVDNNRVTAQTNDFVTTLTVARSEAVKRRLPVSVCASSDQMTCSGSNDWSTGWILFTDNSGVEGKLDDADALIHVSSPLSESTNFSSTVNSIRYGTKGSLRTVAGSVFTLEGTDCVGDKRRIIAVMPSGHFAVQKTACI
jgi:type IV fimbrial biogenesis protein FimT